MAGAVVPLTFDDEWSGGKRECHALAAAVTVGGRHSRDEDALAVHQPSFSTIAKMGRCRSFATATTVGLTSA